MPARIRGARATRRSLPRPRPKCALDANAPRAKCGLARNWAR
jgi:hypothetical protein